MNAMHFIAILDDTDHLNSNLWEKATKILTSISIDAIIISFPSPYLKKSAE